jgi:hypothetical protein
VTDPIAAALDEFVPAFETAEPDWTTVLAMVPAVLVPADRQSPHRLVRAWHRHRRRRPLLVAVALLAALAVTAAAIAAAQRHQVAPVGAFNGIAGAHHPRTDTDVMDPATATYVREHLVGIQLDTARLIGQLPNGQNIYVITGALNDLCTVVGPPDVEAWCGDPLIKAHPATIYTYPTPNDATSRWITFGVALDGVASVSIQTTQAPKGGPAGPEVTVPVNDNLWIYPSNGDPPPYLLQPVTAHFADGTTVVMPGTGKNCAAC